MVKGKIFWKSKTVWAAVVILAISILNTFGVVLPYEQIYAILAAFGLYGIRDAVQKIKYK